MPEVMIEIEAEDGCIDAFAACADDAVRHPPIILLSDRSGLGPAATIVARRLSAHGYFVLAPDWSRRPREDRREDAFAWLDYLADERRVDDARVGVLGYGAGADLALRLAGWRAERIAAAAAFGGRGFGPATAQELAQRINGVIRLGYEAGVVPRRAGLLEASLCAAGVDFDVEIYEGEPGWLGLLDLFSRALGPIRTARREVQGGRSPLSP